MKKIFYLFLLMMNLTVFGQTYPTIHPLAGGFTFNGEKLETHTQVFGATTPIGLGCNFQFSDVYKYYSFKAGFDMTFAFDLIATKPDFNFIVWKLSADKQPTAIFDRGGTIPGNRSVYNKSILTKGMKDGEIGNCEYEAGNGYVNSFNGTELLKKNETIVIAVYGLNSTDLFDIKVNVAEERTITTFNNLCSGQSYTYQQVVDAIKTDSSLSDIKLYTDGTFSSEIPAGTSFNSDTTIYAQVRDASGSLKYIYDIPLKFIPEHVFNFNATINQVFECTLNYTLKENTLLNLLFPSGTNLSNYKIKTVNGTAFVENSTINLTAGGITDLKIIVSYNGTCPVDSVEKTIQVKQGTPVLAGNISDVTCDSNYKINFDQIFTKIGFSKNDYDLIVTLSGSPITDGTSTPITSTLTYKVKVKSKTAGCESNEIDFVVTKTSPANIIPTTISTICLDDFTQTHVDNAINTIQNGNSYKLKYFQADGLTPITDLYTYIKTTVNGKIIVKALAVDNGNTICDTEVDLTFNLDKSTFVKVDNIPTLKSTCVEVGAGHTFTVSEIENHLKTVLGTSVAAFQGISNETLGDNQFKTIRFRVQKTGESCWSDEMQLTLQVITKPNVPNASKELKADCNNLITINSQVLSDLFGATSITNYDYQILHSNSTPLTFDASGKTEIKVIFKNKMDNNCSVEKIIVINKKPDLIVDRADIESNNLTHKIVYCEDNTQAAKTQIQNNLDYIKLKYPTLVAKSTVDQIFGMFNSNDGFVEVVFEDPNYCGTVTIKFFYQKNGLPTITVPAKGSICTDTLFELDFTTQTNYANYNYIVEKADGEKISGIDYFNLEIGTYKITIEDKLTGCSVVKTLVVESSPLPTLEKITVTEKSIVVTAKGSGKLEYALFDDRGNIVVNWQTNNELIIPDNIINNNFTVKVRLNNCGISTFTNITYLALPSFISPNNDGKNDFWQPMTKNGKVNDTTNSYRLIIFDRYGKQILNREGIDIIKWDGMHLGKPVLDGTYWYLLEPIGESDILQVQYSGSILVKRKIN
ncbi:T9SS type B sorting domain-containing protein [Algoriella sp.]|uniref:T9SS type B sorting domain-containing protein n=1 Tax=Algoriella sp. TaxID=1872434 RepID=UPI002FCBED2A